MPAAMDWLIVILNDGDVDPRRRWARCRPTLSRLLSGRTPITVPRDQESSSPTSCRNFRAARREGRGVRHASPAAPCYKAGLLLYQPIDGHENLDHLMPVLKKRARRQDRADHSMWSPRRARAIRPPETSADKYGVVAFRCRHQGTAGQVEGSAPPIPGRREPHQGRPRRTPRVVAIRSRGTVGGTGLDLFGKEFRLPVDVGIAGNGTPSPLRPAFSATEGYKPFAVIYSTFLQRAYDQVVHDVAESSACRYCRYAMDRADWLAPTARPTCRQPERPAYLGCLPTSC